MERLPAMSCMLSLTEGDTPSNSSHTGGWKGTMVWGSAVISASPANRIHACIELPPGAMARWGTTHMLTRLVLTAVWVQLA